MKLCLIIHYDWEQSCFSCTVVDQLFKVLLSASECYLLRDDEPCKVLVWNKYDSLGFLEKNEEVKLSSDKSNDGVTIIKSIINLYFKDCELTSITI